jgi:hypothetical protein
MNNHLVETLHPSYIVSAGGVHDDPQALLRFVLITKQYQHNPLEDEP